ncbi:MAG: radical SAM protein [Alphaproteobacteria bacterium]|nr:radical SAM protein [Alphaproteobacteria bacterium]
MANSQRSKKTSHQLVFGPVPSRRLGRSLGVNHIPHKVCSYSCSYCQIGKAIEIQIQRQPFFSTEFIILQIKKRLNKLLAQEYPNYITFVPDGEPTLDINLGLLIKKIKQFGFPVAIITNGSLLHFNSVKDDLMGADYISIKIDSVNPTVWRQINRPHKGLNLEQILRSIMEFSKDYTGTLVTETMLIKGKNDNVSAFLQLADFIKDINPQKAYIAIPTRPPAFSNTFPADEQSVTQAYNAFSRIGLSAELLIGYEGNAFTSTGSFREDLLSITSVHPLRAGAVNELMTRSDGSAEMLKMLICKKLIKQISYNGEEYYVRRFTGV